MIERPVLRWLGGKFRLARWIIAHFPYHDLYVEPYGGAASVLLQKERAYNEVWNDLDGDLVNLFRVMRGPQAAELLRQLHLTPYAEAEYQLALQVAEDPIERARRMIVRSHMGHGTGGARLDRPTGFRMDGTSIGTNVAGEWAELPAALEAVCTRFKGVTIVQRPALQLIRRYNDPKALIYLDPPYIPDTRSAKSKKGGEKYHTYQHEMTVQQHEEMLDEIAASRAMIVLSGYPNDLYAERLKGWTRRTCAARAHRNSPRTEGLWLSPAVIQAQAHGPLFGAAANG